MCILWALLDYPQNRSIRNTLMTKETRFVTVYWSEIVHMRCTIEVDKDEQDDDYMFSQAFEQCPRAGTSFREIEPDSIEIFEGLDLENE